MVKPSILVLALLLPTVIYAEPPPAAHLVPPGLHRQNFRAPRHPQQPQQQQNFMQRIARWLGFGNGPPDQQIQASQAQPNYKEGYTYNKPQIDCNPCNKAPWLPMFSVSSNYPLGNGFNQQHHQQTPPVIYNHNSPAEGNKNQHNSYPPFAPQLIPTNQALPKPGPPLPFHQVAAQQNFNRNLGQKSIPLSLSPPRNLPNNYFPPNHLLPLEQRPHHLIPIPIPSLSITPVPPLYNAVPFRVIQKPAPNKEYLEPVPQLSQHREVSHLNSFIPLKHGISDPKFEIVKSVPVSEFISSVEYPAKVIQSPIIDLSKLQPTNNYGNFQPPINSVQNSNRPHGPVPSFAPNAERPYPGKIENVERPQNTLAGPTLAPPPETIQHQDPPFLPTPTFGGAYENSQAHSDNSYPGPNSQGPTGAQSINDAQNSNSQQITVVQSVEKPLPQSDLPLDNSYTNVHGIDSSPAQISNQNFQQTYQNSNQDGVPKLTELGSFRPQPQSNHGFTLDPIVVNNNHPEIDNYPEASSHNITYRHENKLDTGNYVNPPDDLFVSTTEAPPPTEQETHLKVEKENEKVHVDFQPSLQTASDKPTHFKRDRETPKRLLDLPIYHQRSSTPKPFTKEPEEVRIPAPQNYQNDNNPWRPSPTSVPWAFEPTPTSSYTAMEASGRWAGISPPAKLSPTPQALPFQPLPEKQTTQVKQIIIPYTTKNQPSPFKTREEIEQLSLANESRYVNWSHAYPFEIHEQQESKLVTATEAPTKKTTKYLTKILASNIRELLKREHEVRNKTKSGFDIKKLQKNIDGWTEQQYTSLSHKASTVSIRGSSKIIPTEYLTTTPSLLQLRASSATESPTVTTTKFPNLLGDEEVRKYDVLEKLIEDNQIERDTTTIVPTTTPQNSTTVETTSVQNTTAQTSITPLYIRAVSPSPSPNAIWNKVKVSISPLTNEKVYVVTPQPKFPYVTRSSDKLGMFKSPRFQIRPTPATGPSNLVPQSTGKAQGRSYTPELFGLMGISTFSSPSAIETLDGHSKVITVVTPQTSRNNTLEAELLRAKKEIRPKELIQSGGS